MCGYRGVRVWHSYCARLKNTQKLKDKGDYISGSVTNDCSKKKACWAWHWYFNPSSSHPVTYSASFYSLRRSRSIVLPLLFQIEVTSKPAPFGIWPSEQFVTIESIESNTSSSSPGDSRLRWAPQSYSKSLSLGLEQIYTEIHFFLSLHLPHGVWNPQKRHNLLKGKMQVMLIKYNMV